MLTEPTALAAVVVAMFLGGVLKGATGTGVPIVAVPVMVLFADLQVAISVIAVVNLISNVAQAWQYRHERNDVRLSRPLAIGSGVGTVFGTFALVTAPPSALLVALALVVLSYIAFRAANPAWKLSRAAGRRASLPTGLFAGVLQGATGISAPIAVSFLNALGLQRPEFIAVITAAFTAMAVPQLAALWAYGILEPARLLLALAVTPFVFAGMPVGSYAVRRVGAQLFDRIILTLLAVIALRLLYTAMF